MPSFLTNTAGGKSIATMIAPRSRRGNTNQVASYWAGGAGPNPPTAVEYLVIGGGAGAGNRRIGWFEGGGGA